MPFVLIEANEFYKVGLWTISESEDFFAGMMNYEPVAVNSARRVQQYASRAVLMNLEEGFPLHLICKNEKDKPVLADGSLYLNISHTNEIAAAIVSGNKQVGIDIEKVDARVHNVLNRFLGPDEIKMIDSLKEEEKTSAITLCWSIKETVYKWWGKGNVDFARDVKISSLSSGDKALLEVDFLADQHYRLTVHCMLWEKHWLTYLIQ